MLWPSPVSPFPSPLPRTGFCYVAVADSDLTAIPCLSLPSTESRNGAGRWQYLPEQGPQRLAPLTTRTPHPDKPSPWWYQRKLARALRRRGSGLCLYQGASAAGQKWVWYIIVHRSAYEVQGEKFGVGGHQGRQTALCSL